MRKLFMAGLAPPAVGLAAVVAAGLSYGALAAAAAGVGLYVAYEAVSVLLVDPDELDTPPHRREERHRLPVPDREASWRRPARRQVRRPRNR